VLWRSWRAARRDACHHLFANADIAEPAGAYRLAECHGLRDSVAVGHADRQRNRDIDDRA